MIPLEKFKDSLGELKNKMSEKDILRLRENQDKMADLFFTMWVEKINKKL